MTTRSALFSEWAESVWPDESSGMKQVERRVFINLLSVWAQVTAGVGWASAQFGPQLSVAVTKGAEEPLTGDEEFALRTAIEWCLHDVARYCALHRNVARHCRPRAHGALGLRTTEILGGVERNAAVTAVREELVYGIPEAEFLGNSESVAEFVDSCRGPAPVRVDDGATVFSDEAPPADAVARRACRGEYLFHVEKILAELHAERRRLAAGRQLTPSDSVLRMFDDVPALAGIGKSLALDLGREFPSWEPATRRAWVLLHSAVLSVDDAVLESVAVDEHPVVSRTIADLVTLDFRGRSEVHPEDVRRMFYAKRARSAQRREEVGGERTGTASAVTVGEFPDSMLAGRTPHATLSEEVLDPTGEAVAETGIADLAVSYLLAEVDAGHLQRTFELESAIAILSEGAAEAAHHVSDRAELAARLERVSAGSRHRGARRMGQDLDSTLDLVVEHIADALRAQLGDATARAVGE